MAAELKERTVVAAGYTPLDVVVHGGNVGHAAGGTAGNVAAILAYLGWSSVLVGETGDDLAGVAIREDLARSCVSAEHLRTAGGETARVVHRIGATGHTFEFSCPTCEVKFPQNRRLTVGHADEVAQSLGPPAVFFFDRANPGTVRLAGHFAGQGTLIVFEPAFGVAAPHAKQALRLADVVKLSGATIPTGRDILDARAGQTQIITHGSGGAEYRESTGPWRQVPAFDSGPVVDAAGAGDWTTACLLDMLSRDTEWPLEAALAYAQTVAAISCGFVGARGLAYSLSPGALQRGVRDALEGEMPPRLRLGKPTVYPRAGKKDTCPTCLEPVATSDRQTATNH